MTIAVAVEERFWSKVEKTDTCWLFHSNDTQDPKKYGRFAVSHRVFKRAHRFSFELFLGRSLEKGEHLHHTCRVRRCVNPAHLRIVTPFEHPHLHESAPPSINSRKTHCVNGHLFDDANTRRYVPPDRRAERRACRTCLRSRQRAYRRRKRAEQR